MNIGYKNIILNIVILLIFSFMSTYLQEYFSFLFLLYFVAIMGIQFLLLGKQTKKLISNVKLIESGKKLFEESREIVMKLRLKDRELSSEMKGQGIILLFQLIPLLIFFPMIFIGSMRSGIINLIKNFIIIYVYDNKLASFISFFLLYFMFFLISLITMRYSSYYLKKKNIPHIVIPSEYIITNKGLLLDKSQPILFPLKAKDIKMNTNRKFVEISISSKDSPMMPSTRDKITIRLYTNRTKELRKILEENKALSE